VMVLGTGAFLVCLWVDGRRVMNVARTGTRLAKPMAASRFMARILAWGAGVLFVLILVFVFASGWPDTAEAPKWPDYIIMFSLPMMVVPVVFYALSFMDPADPHTLTSGTAVSGQAGSVPVLTPPGDCPRCGQAIPPGSPQGLCPRC